MKKIIILMLILLTGCSPKNKQIDMDLNQKNGNSGKSCV